MAIHILSQATINKIAAGEVIERPANVVKELLENALDAKATKISMAIEEGGKDLIRVADNGLGMRREDLKIAWLPHTTSKIRQAEDLEAVATFGFRGEALCSVAAIAELTIESRHAEEETGARIVLSDSVQQEWSEISRNLGTTVTVRNLFLHTPVRRKFMASAKSESTKILQSVLKVAFAYPQVSFRLMENGREILHLSEGSLKHRAGEVFGFAVAGELIPVNWFDGAMHIEGFVCTPQQARARASQQFYYINRRSIQSGMMSRAFAQSYDVLPPGRYPMGVLFFTMPPEEVDVNVHPTKKEVRFLNEGQIYWATQQAVKTTLRTIVESPTLDLITPPASLMSSINAEKNIAPKFVFQEESAGSNISASTRPFVEEKQIALFPENSISPKKIGSNPVLPGTQNIPYLQLHQRYIVFAVESGFMLLQQQAAHERILYEKALVDLRSNGRLSSQQLLFPEILDFSPVESRLLEENLNLIQALGFDLESFGGNTFQLRGLPFEIRPEQGKKNVYDLVQQLLIGEKGKSESDFVQKIARAFARTACIKLGQALDYAQITALVDGLFATQNPFVSPSGDAIVIRYPLDEIERKLGLI